MNSETLTRAQVAELLGKSERMVANYVRDGKLTATYGEGKTRSVLLFSSDEVSAFKEKLDSGTVNIVESQKTGNDETRNNEKGNRNNEIGSALVPISRKQETGNASSYFIISDEQLSSLVSQPNREVEGPLNLAAKLLLTIPEAMVYSGIREKPIRDAIKNGQLKSIRIGRSTQVRPEDLKAWVNSQFK